MDDFFKEFYYSDTGKADERCIIEKNKIRISVLTPCLLRIETQNEGVFCDLPTQKVINRQFDVPEFKTEFTDDKIIITTQKSEFCFSAAKEKMLYIKTAEGKTVKDYNSGNLKGTRRTLDGTNGRAKLENGILSKNGVAVLDDSLSLTVGNNGDIVQREATGSDKYYFAYGKEYRAALNDYFRLTGYPPLIPRFSLGNWWSRYKAYTQDEYLSLIRKFTEKNIPITVATVDMDWHWVDVIKKFGQEAKDQKPNNNSIAELFYYLSSPGWTGYSWNTDLFPEPEEFLRELKSFGCKVTLNLHPASGCKFFEDAYSDFCDHMGIDKNSKEQIHFDITDKKFIEGYFKFLHYPHEKNGVDFWWIDWQQGKKTKIPGLDPLWALNHYHYLDNSKNGNRPLILSRFAGTGSQRYPLGFSGDTSQTWATLNFQPYFTSTASNIGYTWWSHDIGGHHFGRKDDELYLRWVQFGVFSPIMRLHSTSNEFMGKEPWKYRGDVEYFTSEFLRLRHRLIPYIYSMAYLSSTEGRPLCEPMYYEYPNDERAYKVPNQYRFGTELIVCPVTEKINRKTGFAKTEAFIPDGIYTDIFNGRIYKGDKLTKLFRDESSIPVLAKEGAIIPMSGDSGNSVNNPVNLEILIFNGNSDFVLYEDDGETSAYKHGSFCKTKMAVSCSSDKCEFNVGSSQGDISVVPEKRNYTLIFKNVKSCETANVRVNEKEYPFETGNKNGNFAITISGVSPEYKTAVTLENIICSKNITETEFRIEAISKLQGNNIAKNKYKKVINNNPEKVHGTLREILREYDSML